jgi:hypothetical protein
MQAFFQICPYGNPDDLGKPRRRGAADRDAGTGCQKLIRLDVVVSLGIAPMVASLDLAGESARATFGGDPSSA